MVHVSTTDASASTAAAGQGASEATRSNIVLEVRDLGFTYGRGRDAVQAIDGLSLAVHEHEFLCVVGPSGAGKTTLLKIVAGLLSPTTGQVIVEGKPVNQPPPGLAMVFQEYTRSLMPWLTVRRNVSFPLAARGVPKSEQASRADAALREVGLAEFQDKYPWQLSGGMQQRVAIARAVAYRPSVLLMDEPFASVDAQVRADLEDLMLRVQKNTGVTVVFVTHDIDEAVYLGERVAILSHRPTTVRTELVVPLSYPRDQLRTRALPEFVELRTRVLAMIRAERASTDTPSPTDGVADQGVDAPS
jgi:NitT/TauT family transport system ATP-binding protein